jgi:cytochrome c oxidase cbb3-type subunit III
MYRQILTMMTLAVVSTALGCKSTQSGQIAPEGASPPISVPVGPAPGFSLVPPEQKNPYAQDPFALADGRKLFQWYNCDGCHGGHGGGGMGPSLRDSVWLYGDSDSQVFNSIAEGRGRGMPAWGLKIPDQQIWELAAYVKSLRSPLEPDPPE